MTRRKRLILASTVGLLAGWVLASCQMPADNYRTETLLAVAQSCDAYSAALEVLTSHKEAGRLSQSELELVDRANMTADHICAPGTPEPEDPIDALTDLADAVADVMILAADKECEEDECWTR